MPSAAFDITDFPGRRATIPGRSHAGRTFFIIETTPRGMYDTIRLQDIATGEIISYEAAELSPAA